MKMIKKCEWKISNGKKSLGLQATLHDKISNDTVGVLPIKKKNVGG